VYSALTPWAMTLSSSTLELMKLAVFQVSVRVTPVFGFSFELMEMRLIKYVGREMEDWYYS
jgi:hypothetical protein